MTPLRKIKLLEEALVRAILETSELHEEIEDAANTKCETEYNDADIAGFQSAILKAANELNELKCQGFPGEAMLVVEDSDGRHKPTVKDLRRLCEANGLTVLEKGQYLCAACGGVRTTDACTWCQLTEPRPGT